MIPSIAWSVIRNTLRDNFSFADIKDIAGKAGLPVYSIGHITQKYSGGSSKGQLMDELDKLFSKLNPSDQSRVIIYTIEVSIKAQSKLVSIIDEDLRRIGWYISDGNLLPLTLQVDISLTDLPDNINQNLKKSLVRFRDGDISGAISSLCASIDTLTEEMYIKEEIGNPKDATFHERISKAFASLEKAFNNVLQRENIDKNKTKILWDNQKKAISSAGYVLGEFRREYSDVHGHISVPPKLAQIAMNNCLYIIKTFNIK